MEFTLMKLLSLLCSFSCSLLRQGMKQICISATNIDGTANDSKEVCLEFGVQ